MTLVLVTLSACAQQSSDSSQVSCPSINADQSGSFMAKVSGFPLTINADSTFTADEQNSLQLAVQAWNDFGQSIAGTDLFTISVVDIDDATRAMDPHACSQAYGNQRQVVLVREADQTHWAVLGLSEDVPGATIRCSSNGVVTQQMTAINTGLITHFADLGQIFTHELGHAIGLDHSCNGASDSSTSSYATCTGLTNDDPYHQAVMYPMIQSDSDTAPLLRDNDKARGACMVQSTVGQ